MYEFFFSHLNIKIIWMHWTKRCPRRKNRTFAKSTNAQMLRQRLGKRLKRHAWAPISLYSNKFAFRIYFFVLHRSLLFGSNIYIELIMWCWRYRRTRRSEWQSRSSTLHSRSPLTRYKRITPNRKKKKKRNVFKHTNVIEFAKSGACVICASVQAVCECSE